jgi:hypothetical protein
LLLVLSLTLVLILVMMWLRRPWRRRLAKWGSSAGEFF